MVLAIGTFTMLSVGTYIHQLNAGSGGSNSVQQLLHRAESWFGAREQTPVGAPSTQALAASPTLASLSRAKSGTTLPVMSTPSTDPSTLLNSANDQRMLSIAQTLVGRMTASDWSRVMSLLQSSDVKNAQGQLATLLESKVSPGDAAWLKVHFQGKQAFDQSDIVLLQQTFQELQHMFTPAEQQMLKQKLQQLGISLNG